MGHNPNRVKQMIASSRNAFAVLQSSSTGGEEGQSSGGSDVECGNQELGHIVNVSNIVAPTADTRADNQCLPISCQDNSIFEDNSETTVINSSDDDSSDPADHPDCPGDINSIKAECDSVAAQEGLSDVEWPTEGFEDDCYNADDEHEEPSSDAILADLFCSQQVEDFLLTPKCAAVMALIGAQEISIRDDELLLRLFWQYQLLLGLEDFHVHHRGPLSCAQELRGLWHALDQESPVYSSVEVPYSKPLVSECLPDLSETKPDKQLVENEAYIKQLTQYYSTINQQHLLLAALVVDSETFGKMLEKSKSIGWPLNYQVEQNNQVFSEFQPPNVLSMLFEPILPGDVINPWFFRMRGKIDQRHAMVECWLEYWESWKINPSNKCFSMWRFSINAPMPTSQFTGQTALTLIILEAADPYSCDKGGQLFSKLMSNQPNLDRGIYNDHGIGWHHPIQGSIQWSMQDNSEGSTHDQAGVDAGPVLGVNGQSSDLSVGDGHGEVHQVWREGCYDPMFRHLFNMPIWLIAYRNHHPKWLDLLARTNAGIANQMVTYNPCAVLSGYQGQVVSPMDLLLLWSPVRGEDSLPEISRAFHNNISPSDLSGFFGGLPDGAVSYFNPDILCLNYIFFCMGKNKGIMPMLYAPTPFCIVANDDRSYGLFLNLLNDCELGFLSSENKYTKALSDLFYAVRCKKDKNSTAICLDRMTLGEVVGGMMAALSLWIKKGHHKEKIVETPIRFSLYGFDILCSLRPQPGHWGNFFLFGLGGGTYKDINQSMYLIIGQDLNKERAIANFFLAVSRGASKKEAFTILSDVGITSKDDHHFLIKVYMLFMPLEVYRRYHTGDTNYGTPHQFPFLIGNVCALIMVAQGYLRLHDVINECADYGIPTGNQVTNPANRLVELPDGLCVPAVDRTKDKIAKIMIYYVQSLIMHNPYMVNAWQRCCQKGQRLLTTIKYMQELLFTHCGQAQLVKPDERPLPSARLKKGGSKYSKRQHCNQPDKKNENKNGLITKKPGKGNRSRNRRQQASHDLSQVDCKSKGVLDCTSLQQFPKLGGI